MTNWETILHDAARECGMDGHTKVITYKKDAFTRAEQLAAAFTKRPFECKNSCLYCNALDATFYFSRGEAMVAFSGAMRFGDSDFDKAEKTLALVKKMLSTMDRMAKEASND